MTTDAERAESDAWQELADACCEHDCDHERRALTELDRLHQLPGQREETA